MPPKAASIFCARSFDVYFVLIAITSMGIDGDFHRVIGIRQLQVATIDYPGQGRFSDESDVGLSGENGL